MPEDTAGPDLTPLAFSTATGPAGERVAVRSAPGSQALIVYHDGSEPTDLSAQLPDLVMLGWREASLEAGDPDVPVETVEVCKVSLPGHWEVYIADHTGEVYQVPTDTVLEWLEASVVSLISTGVAYEAIEDDPDLDNPNAAHTPDTSTTEDGETP
jgi:hypothetical protein